MSHHDDIARRARSKVQLLKLMAERAEKIAHRLQALADLEEWDMLQEIEWQEMCRQLDAIPSELES